MARIGIIGNGNVGTALNEGLGKPGHEVRAAGHDTNEVRSTAEWAQSIILAVPYAERENAFKEMGDACTGKVVVDATNALTPDHGFAGNTEKSGAEELQETHDCKVVKAFNTVFAERMKDGQAQGEPLSLLVAGNDEDAKAQVMSWARDIGFDGVDAGGIENARWLETLGYLNIQMGHKVGHGTGSGWRYVHPGVRTRREEPTAQTH